MKKIALINKKLNPINLLLQFILLCAIVFNNGCMSAAKKAQKEANEQEVLRQKENMLFEKMRKLYPCDTSSSTIKVSTITKYLYGKPVMKHDTAYVTDTVETESKISTQHTVIDSSVLKEAENRVKSAQYKLDSSKAAWDKQRLDYAKTIATLTHDNAIYKNDADKWDRLIKWLLSIVGVIAAAGLIWGFLKFKSKIGL